MEKLKLIRNEENLIKVYDLGNNCFQTYPEIEDKEYALVTDEQLEKLISRDYIFNKEGNGIIENFQKKYDDLAKEMADNDWKQLRANRHLLLNGVITDEDREVLLWFEEKAKLLEEHRNKIK